MEVRAVRVKQVKPTTNHSYVTGLSAWLRLLLFFHSLFGTDIIVVPRAIARDHFDASVITAFKGAVCW
jgi:hypothetical protein